MRKREIVAVGQGCKAVTLYKDDRTKSKVCMCQIHSAYYLNVCLGCGERFHTDRPHTKTCGDKCRQRHSRSKNDKLFQMIMQFAGGD